MRLVKRDGSDFILRVSAAEIERLYDSLDAENDRFEGWLGYARYDEQARLESVLAETKALNDDFQPLIHIVRGD